MAVRRADEVLAESHYVVGPGVIDDLETLLVGEQVDEKLAHPDHAGQVVVPLQTKNTDAIVAFQSSADEMENSFDRNLNNLRIAAVSVKQVPAGRRDRFQAVLVQEIAKQAHDGGLCRRRCLYQMIAGAL